MVAQHLTLADAILLAALAVVAPAYSCYAGVRIAGGRAPERIPAYGRTMLSLWLIALTMLFVWSHLGRPFVSLGLLVPFDARSVFGAVLCVLMLAFMNGQWRVVRRLGPEKLARLGASFGRAIAILPHSRREYGWFLALSVTAGICEELLYRGYLVAVASPLLTLAGAVVAGAAIFGFGHAYQGAIGIVKTAGAGLFLGVVYVATGSLLWPVILHALLDVQGGTIAFKVLGAKSVEEVAIR
jgi:membrane protease YdiL (CAAX protease family)